MGYQALLFCPDEKLARVVTQVFSDLDFAVVPVNEPFAAVKKLMAQRYDAIVVDCENEQNASLLFKSARNSSSNQSSLALALVEGQAGVAKAYRIGANLVLTKPINVEQAKGTLRVARGLLRKNLDASAPAAAGKAAPASTASSVSQDDSAQVAATHHEAQEFESALPALAGLAETDHTAISIPVPENATPPAPPSVPPAPVAYETPALTPEPEPVPVLPSAIRPAAGALAATAAAPAPAKEPPAPAEKKSTAPEFIGHAPVSSVPLPVSHIEAPTFAALEKEDTSEGSGGGKKLLIAAAVVVAALAIAYFGWTKFEQKSGSPSPATTPQSLNGPSYSAAPPSASAPVSAPASSPSSSASIAKPSASVNNSSKTADESATEDEPETRKTAGPAIVVKSAPVASRKASAQSEEAVPQVPSPLAVEPANDKHISSLVASAPVNLPKAVPSTLRISQGVSQGLLIKRVQPRYPQNALSMRLQGAVQLEATVDKEGNVKNVKVTSGDPILARAATEAVRQWRYKPYYLDGDPVEIQTQITVNFKLPN
ncbi:MAG TPA: energy transducer TonB [Terriglobales bacterium]|nr:energy transducer TonB [Terriglobales bacterium]